jgi:flagellar hook-associated protein 2
MALSSPGVGSGLDVGNIVSQLMSIERRPLDQLDRREVAYQAQLSAYGNLRSALSSFRSSVSALDSLDRFTAPSLSVGDSSVLTASAAGRAQAGSYAIDVTQLAQAQSLVAAGQTSAGAAIGSGAATTLRFEFGTISGGTLTNGIYSGAAFTQNASQPSTTVTIDSSNNSLEGIRNAINAANLGVAASIVKDGSAAPYRLVLQSATTGLARSLRVTVTGDAALQSLLGYDPAGVQNLTQTAAAQDAALSVNGVAITSASNSVADAIEGVTLTLLKAGSTRLTVGRDSAAAKSAIEAFVKGYNELAGTLGQLAKFDTQSEQRGPLLGDATLRTIQAQLRGALSAALGGPTASGLRTLSQAGIAFQRDGTLALDNAKLSAALAGDGEDLAGLFTTLGRASDGLVRYAGAGAATQAGSYAVEVSALATQGSLVGSAPAGLTITAGVNDQLSITVDGVVASVTLAAGTYTAATLAAQVQAAVNGATALAAAGAGVLVSEAGGVLTFTSKRFGSVSSVSAGGTAAAGLLGGAPVSVVGSDVTGSIGGTLAVGSGQTLTGASGTAAGGLALTIAGGALGDRGRVQFSRGYAHRLGALLDALLSSSGPISGRTDGINRSIEDLDERRATLERRLQAIEQRYRAQFTALDTLVSNMRATSDFLSQQLALLPVPGSDQS